MSFWEKLRGKVGSLKPAVAGQPASDPQSNLPSRQGATVLRPTGAAIPAKAPAELAADSSNMIAGTFPIKKVLGSGSMGTVYLVQDPFCNTEVALKVPTAVLIADAENRHRLVVEAEA